MCLDCQLIKASRDGDLSQVKKLIKNGTDVHTDDDHPLRYAAWGGHLDVVKYLVEDHNADVHARDDDAFCWAAWKGHLEVVKYLVEDCGADIHARDDCAFRRAAGYGHLDVVKYLNSYTVSQFTKRHIDKQKRIEKLNQVFKEIRALPGIGIDFQKAFEHFNHLKTIY